ncbi:PIR Superfamily Protein [Plasmodium ovale wallikeri]|uniref:PIR Superfamily Protein n=2 Tax=Plasmodium ovale TaxID=36330 RepID=A0A1A9AQN6_PLAOA|nr:PIR Superfamily Protein [Plasmodium ovale wallikeri]SBT59519.1 PIR Superfamily Protein [Plasmodium ovale wallikeri]SBT72894.1 Plasmodium vivax Vir protein, putative [Plasmodium ovale]
MNRNKHILYESPSYIFNKELNSVIKTCRFCSSCDKKEGIILYEYGLKTLCYYFARNLEKIYNIRSDDEALNDKRCNDVFYWLHDNLINTYDKMNSAYGDTVKNFKEVWEDIIETNSEILKEKFCESSFERLNSFTEHKNYKEVSDYCEYYKFIEKKLENTNESCAVYYQYLTKNSKTYDIISKGCTVNGKNYCLNYNKCNTYHPQKLLSKTTSIKAKESEEKRIKSVEEEEQYIQCGPEYECVLKNSSDTSINHSDYRIVPLIVLSIWGIILSFYFIYKFSPFRSWLNNHLYKKNIIKKNLHNDEFQELLESDSEDAHINFNNREYHITYNRE